MSIQFNFYRTKMPESRKADYILGCLDGSVFIDFNRSEEDQIYLYRISFDGYGCCSLGEKSKCLDYNRSKLFIEEMEREDLNQELLTELIKKIILINRKYIWDEALEKYSFI